MGSMETRPAIVSGRPAEGARFGAGPGSVGFRAAGLGGTGARSARAIRSRHLLLIRQVADLDSSASQSAGRPARSAAHANGARANYNALRDNDKPNAASALAAIGLAAAPAAGR